jgi:hypothetical protein
MKSIFFAIPLLLLVTLGCVHLAGTQTQVRADQVPSIKSPVAATAETAKPAGPVAAPIAGTAAVPYAEFSVDGRTYVAGTLEGIAKAEHGHLPYSRTYIRRGAKGETVIVEVDPKGDALADRLWATYIERNLYYAEADKDGRTYLIGTREQHEAFKTTGHLPYTKTHIGAGHRGQTIVAEVDKGNAHLAKRLMARYSEANLYYADIAKDGRIYLIGSEATHAAFRQTGHLPYTQTHIGTGPRGETIVAEVDKSNPHLAKRLLATYSATNLYNAEAQKDGRIYLIGDADTHAAFRQTGHMPYTQTHIGAGPRGETIVVEVDKGSAHLAARLMRAYAATNLYYAAERKDGRIYLIGDAATHEAFRQTGHLPYTQTHIGAGPRGETIVAEVDKSNTHLATRLMRQFREHNLYYAEEMKDGRYYVIGSESMHQGFRSTGHLPYTQTHIGAGPGRKTVVVEVDKDNPHHAARLWREFTAQHGL